MRLIYTVNVFQEGRFGERKVLDSILGLATDTKLRCRFGIFEKRVIFELVPKFRF